MESKVRLIELPFTGKNYIVVLPICKSCGGDLEVLDSCFITEYIEEVDCRCVYCRKTKRVQIIRKKVRRCKTFKERKQRKRR